VSDPPEPEYTVEEANAQLGELRPLIEEIRAARQVVLKGSERIRASATTNGGADVSREYWEALAALRRGVEEVNRRGIVLRDPESGLLDFPSRREGKPVYLCWRLEEDHVGFWHGPDSGFSGRRPI
jgi:hypothetical protein